MPTLAHRRSKLNLVILSILGSVALLTSVPVFGQEVPGGDALLLPFIIMMAVAALLYAYFSFALYTIAKKVRAQNDWWAWVPILQIILSLRVAKKPGWWLAPCLIAALSQIIVSLRVAYVPSLWVLYCLLILLNLIIWSLIWMGIAQALGKSSWLGILLIVPVVNLIAVGYLAWSNSTSVPARDPLA